MAEQSSEISPSVARLRALAKFRPSESVHVVLLKERAEFPFIAAWEMARLAAWALFDQQESKRIAKDERENKAVRRPFRPRYAYKAGQLYLWHHLDYFSRRYATSPYFCGMTPKQAALALKLYFETAQVKKDISHRGRTLSSLHNDKDRRRDLMFVYHVMDFLVRASLSGRKDVCKVKIARFFAEKIEPMEEQVSASKVEKVWNQYRAAAPYIYAFYPILYRADGQQDACAEAKKITEEEWICRIARLATKSTLEECLGHAAFAADVLAKTGTRDVRIEDFERVSRVRPSLLEFDAEEQLIFESFDDDAAIE